MRILGGRHHSQEEQSDGSQASVNANRRAIREDENRDREWERLERQFNWRKRVELPVFEGVDPLNWINRA